MSGDGKRSVGLRPQATAPILDTTSFPVRRAAAIPAGYGGTCTVCDRWQACVLMTHTSPRRSRVGCGIGSVERTAIRREMELTQRWEVVVKASKPPIGPP